MPKERGYCKYCDNKYECIHLNELRKTYRDMMSEIRDRHDERAENGRHGAYFNGWTQIMGLVNKTFGQAKYVIENEDEDLAIEYAEKLSDMFYEYREKRKEKHRVAK